MGKPLTDHRRNQARFATTRWSLVLAARTSSADDAREALEALCGIYWFPIYAYARRTGRSPDRARDLTQGFFTMVIERRSFDQARKERGRLRSFLLTSFRHFLSNEYDAAQAQKRGGALPHLAFEFDDGEQRYAREPVDTLTPEDVYERRWAAAVLAAASARLDEKHRGGWMRDSRFFATLKQHVVDGNDTSSGALAERLGSTAGTVRVLVHRIRQQFLVCLREVIADTVDGPAAIDGELQHLRSVVSRAGTSFGDS